jgi:hypothetical protein
MLSALCPNEPLYLPDGTTSALPDEKVAFVALCWPVLDPLARYRMVTDKGIQRLIDAHHAYWPSVEAMAEGNPN